MATILSVIVSLLAPASAAKTVPGTRMPDVVWFGGALFVGWVLHVLPYVAAILFSLLLLATENDSTAARKNIHP